MIISEFMGKVRSCTVVDPRSHDQGCLLDFLRSRGRSVVTTDMQLKFAKDINAAMMFLESQNFVHRLAPRYFIYPFSYSLLRTETWQRATSYCQTTTRRR